MSNSVCVVHMVMTWK